MQEARYAVSIPKETPGGQLVVAEHHQKGDLAILHAESPDLSELYLEVTTFPHLVNHRTSVEEQQAFLKTNSSDGRMSSVEKTVFDSLPATTFSFEGTLQGRWKVRRFLFVDHQHHTYRIVYDPTSKLNEEVLGSFMFKIDT